MTPKHDLFAELYKTDAGYRAWFKRWWAGDFSLTGRKQDLQNNRFVSRHSFAGRMWPQGWAPPHDLNGSPNPSFSWFDEQSVRNQVWEYIRTNLSGSYIEGGGPGFLGHSAANLRFCFFAQDVIIDPPTSQLNLADTFFARSLTAPLQRQVEVDLSRALVANNLSVKGSRPFGYDLSAATIRGDGQLQGAPADGVAHKARISGLLEVRGALSAQNLRARKLSLVQNPSSMGVSKVDLENVQTGELTISGPYSEIRLDKGRLGTVTVKMNTCKLFSATTAKARSMKLTGDGASINISGSHIGQLLEIVETTAVEVDISRCEVNGITSQSLVADRLKCSSVIATGPVSFDRCQFSDEVDGKNSTFEKSLSFARCALPGVVDFSSAEFKNGASFKVGSGADIARSPGFKQIGEARFSGATFDTGEQEVCANFDGRETLEAASFEGAKFAGIPMFYECKFHENISFRGATFDIIEPSKSYLSAIAELKWLQFSKELIKAYRWPSDIDVILVGRAWKALQGPLSVRRAAENHRLSRYERAYNALRQRFSEVGNAKYERQFHNYELRARRRRIDADAPPVESAVSWVYDIFSQYGQSISRPLYGLIFVWAACALCYFAFAGAMTSDGAIEASVFSARQIIKPFSAWSRDFALAAAPLSGAAGTATSSWIESLMLIGTEFEVARSSLVRVIATAESFVAIVFLFLSGLAVRRTFGVG